MTCICLEVNQLKEWARATLQAVEDAAPGTGRLAGRRGRPHGGGDGTGPHR
jgi:hypothetical protein